jgi:superfamily II DNA or RNA helicase
MSSILKPYPYQRTAIDDTEGWFTADPLNQRAAVVIPTGGGKTVVFSHMAKEVLDAAPHGRVLVLVHTDELVRQAVKKILDVAPHLKVGVVKARENETTADVIVASVQTLRNPRRMAQIRNVVRVIVDECHHAVAATYMSILTHFGCFQPASGVKCVGFTATLVRGDERSLGLVWQDVTFTRSISWMVRKRYLIEPLGKTVRVPDLQLSAVKTTRKDFREGELGDALVEAFAPEIVAEAYREHAYDRRGLLFAPTVASAQVFSDAFNSEGIKSEVVHGGLSQEARDAVMDRHRAGITQVVHGADRRV